MHQQEIEWKNNPALKASDSAARDFAQQIWSLSAQEFNCESNNKQTERSLPGLKIDSHIEHKEQVQPRHQGAARDQLVKKLDQAFDKDTCEALKQYMDTFEKKASENQLSKNEVANTYQQINRILSCAGDKPLTPELRKQVVGETLRHCADPEIISQGGHNTCNVTAVQVRAYSLHPSKAAKLIADVATTGQYTTETGIKVKLDKESIVPDKEARESMPEQGHRDYATQLFNLTAVNIWYGAAKPDWHYQQIIEKDEKTHKENVREEIVERSGGKEKPVLNPFTKKPLDSPTLGADQIAFINDAIVGKHEPNAVLTYVRSSVLLPGEKEQKVHAAVVGNKGLAGENDFQSLVQKLKDTHQLPAIAAVNTGVFPLNEDDGSGIYGYESGGHVVSITDFAGGKKPHVSVDNEWSPKEDHPKNTVAMHDVYLCMGGQDEAMKDAAYDSIDAEVKHKAAPVAEMTKFAQTPRLFGVDAQYAKDLAQKVVELAASERALSGEERHKWFSQLRFAVNSTNAEDKVGLLGNIQTSGSCTNAELGWLTAESAKSIHHQKKVACHNGDAKKTQACAKATTHIAKFALALPDEARKNYYSKLMERD